MVLSGRVEKPQRSPIRRVSSTVLSGKVEITEPSPKAKTPYKFFSTEIVLVAVGKTDGEPHTFAVHKDIICHRSPFFKAACTGQFLESESGEVRLPDDRAEVFDLFLQWLYSPYLKQIFAEVTLPVWTTLIELYILADKLQVRALKNAIMDRMLSNADVPVKGSPQRESFPTNADIRLAYDNTPPTSPLRRFLSELFALMRHFSIEKDEVPKDYLYDLALGQRLDWNGAVSWLMKVPHRYHELDNAKDAVGTSASSDLGS